MIETVGCHPRTCTDPWSASKWFAEAEKLEQLAEETKASNVFDDMEITDQTLRLSLQVGREGRRGAATRMCLPTIRVVCSQTWL
jgi:hypothetical protein